MAVAWKLSLLLAFIHGLAVEAFLKPSIQQSFSLKVSWKDGHSSSSGLLMGNLFDDMGNMFEDIRNSFSAGFGGDNSQNNAASEEDDETTENRIITIPGEIYL